MRRQTKQREQILAYLRSTKSHPTADQIYEAVRREIPNISKGTVYRNLQVIREAGEAIELLSGGTMGHFDADCRDHYHFRCDRCGNLFDIDEPVDNEIAERVARRTGFSVRGHRTEFNGICTDCK